MEELSPPDGWKVKSLERAGPQTLRSKQWLQLMRNDASASGTLTEKQKQLALSA
jgi:hypothetical protein